MKRKHFFALSVAFILVGTLVLVGYLSWQSQQPEGYPVFIESNIPADIFLEVESGDSHLLWAHTITSGKSHSFIDIPWELTNEMLTLRMHEALSHNNEKVVWLLRAYGEEQKVHLQLIGYPYIVEVCAPDCLVNPTSSVEVITSFERDVKLWGIDSELIFYPTLRVFIDGVEYDVIKTTFKEGLCTVAVRE